MKETPIIVSGLVVKTSSTASLSSIPKLKFIPSDLPIQFFCWIFTCSGQPSNLSVPCRSSSAKSVIFKNHCFKTFFSTSAPDLQPFPSITCSFASTV